MLITKNYEDVRDGFDDDGVVGNSEKLRNEK